MSLTFINIQGNRQSFLNTNTSAIPGGDVAEEIACEAFSPSQLRSISTQTEYRLQLGWPS